MTAPSADGSDPSAVLDEFVALAQRAAADPPDHHAALQAFREHVVAGWDGVELAVRREVDRLTARVRPDAARGLATLMRAPDLLGPLGLGRREVHHVRALWWLLSSEDPALADARRAALSRFGVEPDDVREVRREAGDGNGGRLDLLLRHGRRSAVVEAKIDQPPDPAQLDRYRAALSAGGAEPWIVLLAPAPPPPGHGADYVITWAHLFCTILPHVHGGTAASAWVASWLVSVGTHVLGVLRPGSFVGWPLPARLRLLRLIDQGGSA